MACTLVEPSEVTPTASMTTGRHDGPFPNIISEEQAGKVFNGQRLKIVK
jgi:hypothetical protein